MADNDWLVMPSVGLSAEDQNRSLLVREREGREVEEEEEEKGGEILS